MKLVFSEIWQDVYEERARDSLSAKVFKKKFPREGHFVYPEGWMPRRQRKRSNAMRIDDDDSNTNLQNAYETTKNMSAEERIQRATRKRKRDGVPPSVHHQHKRTRVEEETMNNNNNNADAPLVS